MALAAYALLVVSLSATAANPVRLQPIDEQIVVPGQPFSLVLNAQVEEGQLLSFRLLNAPPGVTIYAADNGSHEISWMPPASLAAETVLIVQAFDALYPSVPSTQRILLKRAGLPPSNRTLADSSPAIDSGFVNGQATYATLVPPEIQQPGGYGSEQHAPSLPSIAEQSLQVDEEFQLFVRPIDQDGDAVELTARGLPPGAALEPVLAQSWLLHWQPEFASVGEHRIVLTAIDDSPARLQTTRELVFSVGTNMASIIENDEDIPRPGLANDKLVEKPLPSNDLASQQPSSELSVSKELLENVQVVNGVALAGAVGSNTQTSELMEIQSAYEETSTNGAVNDSAVILAAANTLLPRYAMVTEAPSHSSGAAIATSATPVSAESDIDLEASEVAQKGLYFEPLSAQIVSTGSTVQFDVVPRTADDTVAWLHVDRLPAGASFDENRHGSRTFHWPTTNADQGQHVFRFTAVHPDDANQRAITEVMIVVGDPAVPGTQPASAPGG